MKIIVTKATVYVMKYGQDIVVFHTNYPEPLPGNEDTLDLQFRAPRMRGETYVRGLFPEVDLEVLNYSEGQVPLFAGKKNAESL